MTLSRKTMTAIVLGTLLGLCAGCSESEEPAGPGQTGSPAADAFETPYEPPPPPEPGSAEERAKVESERLGASMAIPSLAQKLEKNGALIAALTRGRSPVEITRAEIEHGVVLTRERIEIAEQLIAWLDYIDYAKWGRHLPPSTIEETRTENERLKARAESARESAIDFIQDMDRRP